ncbi:hypothetical protein H8A95_19415 [Bradyrhizobium sp. Pear76]|uniref:hypothetical protein n=1 Tax=Bradyrhizobium oropedii TaxID=1571201 RepID=UPI001E5D6064|nr:hypothetical protein [Bradyrhizobium oropedii]MCC8964425.1 hypothetical protein [Bradyrhizobium oropedii]
MPITLQSTAGGFSAEFMSRLPGLERAMTEGGLEPSDFVFSKDFASLVATPYVGPFFYDYTVFTGGESFTVTEPNDIRFLDYINNRCLAAEQPDEPAVARPPGAISRFLRWMAQPI